MCPGETLWVFFDWLSVGLAFLPVRFLMAAVVLVGRRNRGSVPAGTFRRFAWTNWRGKHAKWRSVPEGTLWKTRIYAYFRPSMM
jgi:hypothetical protein